MPAPNSGAVGMMRAASVSEAARDRLASQRAVSTQRNSTRHFTRKLKGLYSDERTQMKQPLQDIACPFCGLCCDDLAVGVQGEVLTVSDHGCERSIRAFSEPLPTSGVDRQPRVHGESCSLDEAASHAASLLGSAHLPLFAGLGTDVSGARAVLHLADRCGATFDHMNSPAMMRNLLVVQDGGWMTTTLAEVRNRADVIVVFSSDLEHHAPRFFERCINTTETLFHDDALQRRLILFGKEPVSQLTGDNVHTTYIECSTAQLGNVAMALRAIVGGAPTPPDEVAGIPIDQLRDIAGQLQDASYGVVAWATAELAFPHAELAVQAFSELARSLNTNTRCSALPLGGDNGDHTFSQVATWLTGYPTRASLADSHPYYDPVQCSSDRLLADREADLLLWVSAFEAHRLPPVTDIPTILLGRAGMRTPVPPDVFIPVATPGLDHPGHVYRCDTAAVLPLRALRNSGLPSVHETIHAILNSL